MDIINNKYKLINKIGSGSFGSIYKAQNVRTNEYVAIKVEPIIHNLNLLKNETKIYQYLNGSNYIPNVKWYGKDTNNYYMVIDFLGGSLKDLMNKYKTLPLILTLKIGIKILNIIRTIHEKKLIHRDIKPDNFLFGLDDINNIYLIDFGFCKSYMNNGEHIKIKQISNMIGSKNYASINSHNKLELSRRDDLESLSYMLIYFYSGSLPWNDMEDENHIISLKKNIIYELKLPIIFLRYLKYVRALEYEEKPNYYLLIENFKREIELFSKNS